jgi:subtilisin family serine protease
MRVATKGEVVKSFRGKERSALAALALVLAAALVALPTAGAGGSSGDPGIASSKNGVYIVQMLAAPAVAYTGDVAGYSATKPKRGEKLDPAAPDTVQYVDYLKSKHDKTLEKVGGGDKLYDYAYSYDGFAAKLTPAQAAALKKQDGVLAVTPDQLVTQDTSSTPSFLGLDAPGGLWEQLGGPTGTKKPGGAGDGIIIGDIDSGIWPESKSFSDADASGKVIYKKIPKFLGTCEKPKTIADGSWDKKLCNEKLIAAQHFDESWGGDEAIKDQRPWEFLSARDYNGHGTHTASTAGGNNGVQATGQSALFGKISGMAPRARIAAYKALWSTKDGSTASGFTGDLVAAIDQAVADGVDVINYSISGTQTNFLDPVQVAYLFAADAGVFVSASAGNSGPTTGTVAHPGPWLTTVAAGTHNRNGVGTVTLGNGATYSGASLTPGVGPAPLVLATASGLPGATANLLRQCYSASAAGAAQLDPAKVAGKIVVCERGGAAPNNARVDKSAAVQEAGGAGVIIANVAAASLNADLHTIPTVHVDNVAGAAISTYAATAGATATIAQASVVLNAPAPFTAAFSSRGPLAAGGGDLLKPDVIAPGQDILAAVAPPGNGGRDFNLYSGTSMSAPHVAGLAALLKQLHPNWSPMAIKSSLMTSAYDVLDGPNTNPLVIFRQGAGHVRPNSAADPGLVYDSGFNDWLAFLCGTTTGVGPSTCNALSGAGYSLDPSDLNVASIAIGDLAGSQTVKRRVTNVGGTSATYTSTVTGMTGITTVVTPSSLTLNPGQTKTFTVSFTRTDAAVNAYTGGQLTWTDGTHSVRSPLVIRPVALAAPAQVNGKGAALSYNVTFGYTGAFSATARGLVPADTRAGTVADDPTDAFAPGGPGTVSFDVVVPAGTTYARFSLFNEFTDGSDDLDLYVYRVSTNTRVGSSGGGTAAEEVNLVDPPADTYKVWVHGFATDGPDANFTLFDWVLGGTAAGNMAVSAPTSATLGSTGAVNLTFSGLAAATKYLGSVAYSGSAGLPNPTIVRVDTP